MGQMVRAENHGTLVDIVGIFTCGRVSGSSAPPQPKIASLGFAIHLPTTIVSQSVSVRVSARRQGSRACLHRPNRCQSA